MQQAGGNTIVKVFCALVLPSASGARVSTTFLNGHSGRRSLTTSGKVCGYDIPALRSTDDAGAMYFIERGYNVSIGKEQAITGLADTEVRSAAADTGPRWRKKCVKDEDGNCKEATCPEDTYGEITLKGVTELFRDPQIQLRKTDVFADLGSGLGRSIAAAIFVSGVHEAFGVELSERRWSLGCTALGSLASGMKKALGSSARQAEAHQHFEVRHQNILDADLSRPTVIYVASLCFRKTLMSDIQNRLEQQLPTGARVASLRRFPVERKQGQQGLFLQGKTRVMMDWNDPEDLQPVFLYIMKPGSSSNSTKWYESP